jgi:hypothetical protein
MYSVPFLHFCFTKNITLMNLKLIFRIAGLTVFALSTTTKLAAQDMRYGTSRVPQSCPSRSEPKTGAITARQAEKYFTCHVERGEAFNENSHDMSFVTDLKIQVAPKSRRATMADVYRAANLGTPIALNMDLPVYDIRGTYKSYLCNRYTSPVQKKQNCSVSTFPKSQGICFKNSFKDWFCLLTGSSTMILRQSPPQ